MFTSSWFAANVFAVNMVVLCIAGGMVGLLAWAIMKRDERELLTYRFTPEMEREILQSLYTPAEIEMHKTLDYSMYDDTPWEMPDMIEYESDDWYDKAQPKEDEASWTQGEWLLENAVNTILNSIEDRLLASNEQTKLAQGIRKDIEQTQAWFLAYRLTKDRATLGHLVLRH